MMLDYVKVKTVECLLLVMESKQAILVLKSESESSEVSNHFLSQF